MTARALLRVRDSLRVRSSLRRFGVRVLDSHVTPPMPPVGSSARTLVVGHDPIRILVFGCGLGIGYGVTDRREAMDGLVAAAVHAATGRGVVLENRAALHQDGARATRESSGTAGTRTFDVAVFTPDYLAVAEHVSLRGWVEMFQRVAAVVADDPVPLVYVPYPSVFGRHLHLALIRAQVVRAHRALHHVAAAGGHVVAAQGVVTLRDPGAGMFDRDYYASCAPPVAEAVLEALGIPHRRRAAA